MATLRARRASRHGEPPRKGRGRRSAPPPQDNIPRLAAIKLSGGIAGEEVPVSGKSLALAIAGAVIFAGAAIAGAAWMGPSLFDVREAFARGADSAAVGAGFAIGEIEILGVTGARAQEVRDAITQAAPGRLSILSLDPIEVKASVEGLDWVASARVRRLWPSTLEVRVERRQAYARWQEGGELTVIDVNGERLLAERAADHPELPLVVGAGAGPAAEPLLIALEELPALRRRLKALVRVGDRRWNVELLSGTTIALPETDPAIALSRLEGLQAEYHLLDRPLALIDMRAPNRMAVRVHRQLAGGRFANALAGGV